MKEWVMNIYVQFFLSYVSFENFSFCNHYESYKYSPFISKWILQVKVSITFVMSHIFCMAYVQYVAKDDSHFYVLSFFLLLKYLTLFHTFPS